MENTERLPTLLIIYPGSEEDRKEFSLYVAETGEHLATMSNGSLYYVKRDFYDHKDDCIENCTERFGEVVIKFIDETDISENEFIKRNNEFYKHY